MGLIITTFVTTWAGVVTALQPAGGQTTSSPTTTSPTTTSPTTTSPTTTAPTASAPAGAAEQEGAGAPAWLGNVPSVIESADDLLRVLEHSDEDLRTLQARVRYDRVFELAGDRQVREGTLAFTSSPREGQGYPDRAFTIRFERFIVGSRVMDEVETYAFDGRFFTEMREKSKQFVRREVVREGRAADPMRVGQGRFPIPIGQRRDEILARYDVELLAPTQGLEPNDEADRAALEGFVAGTYQLRLVLKEQFKETDELHEVRLWYRAREDSAGGPPRLLPRLARAVSRSGDVTLVQLINVRLNEPVPDAMLRVRAPENDPSWTVREELLPREESERR